jgi:hypothetical protein
MSDDLSAYDDELSDLPSPVGVSVVEDEDGISVNDLAGGDIDDDEAIVLLLKGLVTMLAPMIVEALEGQGEFDDD